LSKKRHNFVIEKKFTLWIKKYLKLFFKKTFLKKLNLKLFLKTTLEDFFLKKLFFKWNTDDADLADRNGFDDTLKEKNNINPQSNP